MEGQAMTMARSRIVRVVSIVSLATAGSAWADPAADT
jgi:hypothetical protein